MKVIDLVNTLGLKVISGNENLEREVTGGYTSDLLSDVMGNLNDGEVWITLQTHRNVMAVASLKDAAAVILIKNLEPDEDLLMFAKKEEIPLLGTSKGAFEISGELYKIMNSAV